MTTFTTEDRENAQSYTVNVPTEEDYLHDYKMMLIIDKAMEADKEMGESMFESFWELYPRKVGKKMARTAWAKLTSKQKVDALAAINNYVKYWKLKETDMEFIPHASSFLNQERFYDELDLTVRSERPKLPWYSSDQLTMEHGQKLGIAARPGESMQQYRSRLASVWSPLSA